MGNLHLGNLGINKKVHSQILTWNVLLNLTLAYLEQYNSAGEWYATINF